MNRLSHIEEKRLRNIIEKNPLDTESRYRLAIMLEEKASLKEADEEYERILELDPQFNNAYRRYRNLHPSFNEPWTSLEYRLPEGSEPLERALFIFHEQKYELLKRKNEIALIPVSLSYLSRTGKLLEWNRLLMRRELEKEEFMPVGTLVLKREDDHREKQGGLILELGSGNLFEKLLERIPQVFERLFSESGFRIKPPEIRISGHIGYDRFRIICGNKLLAHGGLKIGHSLLFGENPPVTGCVDTFCETLNIRGTWINDELASKLTEGGHLILDHVTYLTEILYHVLRNNISSLLDDEKTERFIETLKRSNRDFPWNLVEGQFPRSSIGSLLRYFLERGGKFHDGMSFFDILADLAGSPKDQYAWRREIDRAFQPRQETIAGLQRGDYKLFYIPPEIEEKILLFIDGVEPVQSFSNLSLLIMKFDTIVKKIRSLGKIPALICHPDIKPFIKDLSRLFHRDLSIFSDLEIPQGIPPLFLFDESNELNPPPPERPALRFLYLPRRALFFSGTKEWSLASVIMEGRRIFVYLPGTGLSSGSQSVLLDLQERGYFFEGTYSLTFRAFHEPVEAQQEFAHSRLVTIMAAPQTIQRVLSDPQFKIMADFLTVTLEREYGITPPEIYTSQDPYMKEGEYIIRIGLSVEEREMLPGFSSEGSDRIPVLSGEVSVIDHILDHLLALMENNLKLFFDHGVIHSLLEEAELEMPELQWAVLPRETVKEVLIVLSDERVPLRNQSLIMRKILENREDRADEIAEKIRFLLREEITYNIRERFGGLRFIELDSDMEIVLSTSLFTNSFDKPVPLQEKEYLAKMIAKEYMDQEGGRERLPILCDRCVRRRLREIVKPFMPDVLIIARDEVVQDEPLIPVGRIGPLRGFLKFIIDETLKQGILSEYEEEEEKTLIEIRKIVRENGDKKRALEEDEVEETDPFPFIIRTGRRLAERIECDNQWSEFNCRLLFLREWLCNSSGREVAGIKVILDEEIGENDCILTCGKYPGVQFEVPDDSILQIIDQTREDRSCFPLLGSLTGKWLPVSERTSPRDTLSAGETVLLYLFAYLKNYCRFFAVQSSLKEQILECASRDGQERSEFHQLAEDLFLSGFHPAQIQAAITALGAKLALLGSEAQKDLIHAHCSESFTSYLSGQGRNIFALTLDNELESFILGYLKDISSEALLASPPPSLRRFAILMGKSLQRLVESGFEPLLITEKVSQTTFLHHLIGTVMPRALIFKKGLLPPGTAVAQSPGPGMDLGSLYDESLEIPSDSKTIITISDYYLFRALLFDHSGDCNAASHFYMKIIGLFPDHPTALWRSAFCAQREGKPKVALEFRMRALRSFRKIYLFEPDYYRPGEKRAAHEREFQRIRKAQGINSEVSELRLCLCDHLTERVSNMMRTLKRLEKSQKFDDELYSTIGEHYFEKESFGDALEYFKKALRLNPWNRKAQEGMAEVYLEESQYDRSWSLFRKLLEIYPDNREIIKNLGYASLDRDDYHSTIKLASALIRKEPENHLGSYLRSRGYHSLGNLEKEISDLKKGLELEPESVLLHRTYGELLWEAEIFEEAREHLLNVFKMQEHNSYTIFHRIKILMNLGDLITSKKILTKSMKEAASPALHHLSGELSLKMGNLDDAREQFGRAFRMNPSSSIFELSVAEAALLSGEKQKAESRFKKILRKNPGWIVLYPQLAWLYAEKGQPEEATRLLRRGMGLAPGYLELYPIYFSLSESQDETHFWRSCFQERVALNPLNYGFHFCRGLIDEMLGNRRQAIEHMERAYLISPETAIVVEYLCRLLMMNKDAEKALVILRVALKKILRVSSLYFLEGICWKSLGNVSRAKESLTRASQHDPLMTYACAARGYIHLLSAELIEAEQEASKALQFNGFFGPALILLSEIKKGTPLEGSYLKKALQFNITETWGLRRE